MWLLVKLPAIQENTAIITSCIMKNCFTVTLQSWVQKGTDSPHSVWEICCIVWSPQKILSDLFMWGLKIQGRSLHSLPHSVVFFCWPFSPPKIASNWGYLAFSFWWAYGDSSAAKTNIPCAAQSITVSHSALLLQWYKWIPMQWDSD